MYEWYAEMEAGLFLDRYRAGYIVNKYADFTLAYMVEARP
jgi:hypothetical protein